MIGKYMFIWKAMSYVRYQMSFYFAMKMVETGKIKETSRFAKVDRKSLEEYAAAQGLDITELTPKERADFIDPF